jgi:hypothetical protein
MPRAAVSQLRLNNAKPDEPKLDQLALISRMKGHEDDGNILWNGRSSS